jgi:hypothetical protein
MIIPKSNVNDENTNESTKLHGVLSNDKVTQQGMRPSKRRNGLEFLD